MTEANSRHAPARILLVDDLPANLLALEAILQSTGYEIVKAGSGREALLRVMHEGFAVILLDVFMPEMDGFEVASILKQRERTRHIPIIFVTAAGRDDERVRRGYEVGAIDFLHKPLDPGAVRAKVAALVDLFEENERIKEEADRLRQQDRREHDRRLAALDEARERRYRNLAEAIPPMVWTSRPDGAVDYCNRRWFDYTGLTFQHAQGWGWLAVLHPDDVPTFSEKWRLAIGDRHAFETECRLRNASSGQYRWHLARALPERDAEGTIVAWLGTFTDIDELRQAQLRERSARAEAEAAHVRANFLDEASALLASSLDYGTTLDQVAHLVIPKLGDSCVVDVLSDDGEVTETAAAHVDPEKEKVAASLHEQEPSDAARGLAHVLKTGESEVYPELGDGRSHTEPLGPEHPEGLRALGARSYMIVPLVARGRVLGAITFMHADPARRYDADDLALAEALASRAALSVDNARLYRDATNALAAREEFLSIASHELKTPLTSMVLLLQRMRRRLPELGDLIPRSEITDPLQRVEAHATRLGRLVDELLDFSRLSARRLRLEREPLDLAELVRTVAEGLRPVVEHSGSSLDISGVRPVRGCWDRMRLEQVTANLLANAVKYGRGRPLHVSTGEEDGRAVLRMRDEGIGIAPEQRDRIFAPFHRAVSSREFGGVGLGLYISRQLVLAHQGTIRVESEPGRGSTFIVELPRSLPEGVSEVDAAACDGVARPVRGSPPVAVADGALRE